MKVSKIIFASTSLMWAFFFCRVCNFSGGAISYSLKTHRPWRKFNHLSWQHNERAPGALWSAWQLLSMLMPLPYLHLCWHSSLRWNVALFMTVCGKMPACSRCTFRLSFLFFSQCLSSSSLSPSLAFLLPTVSCFPLFLSAPEPVKFKFSRRFFWRDEFLCCILRMPSVFAGSSSL